MSDTEVNQDDDKVKSKPLSQLEKSAIGIIDFSYSQESRVASFTIKQNNSEVINKYFETKLKELVKPAIVKVDARGLTTMTSAGFKFLRDAKVRSVVIEIVAIVDDKNRFISMVSDIAAGIAGMALQRPIRLFSSIDEAHMHITKIQEQIKKG